MHTQNNSLDSNGSLKLEHAVPIVPPRVHIEIAAWKTDAAFSSSDHVTYPAESQHTLLSRPSPTASSNSKAALDIPDGVSAYTQNDRGYAAAVEAFNSSLPGSEELPKDSENDFKGIGSHFMNGVSNNIGATAVTSMSLEVSNCLSYYAGDENEQDWLPVTDLLRIFTRDSVLQALKEALADEAPLEYTLQAYAGKICPDPEDNRSVGSRSVFAILTHLGKVEEIRQFIDRDLTDDDLPFTKRPGAKDLIGRLYPKSLTDGELVCWDFGSQWHRSDWTAFNTYQKKMRSPFFLLEDSRNRIPHYDLEAGTVLPFIKDYGPKETTRYSQVRRVKIHPGHFKVYNDTKEKAPSFAVKQLLPEQDNSQHTRECNFREEVRALSKIVSHSSHDHVIRLLATWKQGDKWNMLFPWAESNLKEYWLNHDPPNTPKSLRWVAAQCRGLAEGLQKIHRSPSEHATDFGIHGDIKPENILLFVNEKYPDGILVISDFGFTRFHGRDTRSNKPAVGYSPTHRAPEVDLQHPISRSYDIWALGCVFLEFIAWYLTGTDGVKTDFVQLRVNDDVGGYPIKYDKFFNIRVTGDGKKEPEVKSSVRKWIDEVRNERPCSQYFKEFLSFILNDMLSVDPKGRAKCDKVATELRTLESSFAWNSTDYSEDPSALEAESLSPTRVALAKHEAQKHVPRSIPSMKYQEHNETWGPWSERCSNPSEGKSKKPGSMANITAVLPAKVEGHSEATRDEQTFGTGMIRTEASAADAERRQLILGSSRFDVQTQPQAPFPMTNGPSKTSPDIAARLETRSQPKTYPHSTTADSEETRATGVTAEVQKSPGDEWTGAIGPGPPPPHQVREGDSFMLKAMLNWCFPCSRP
ncbi:protein kinase [Colletotrichum orchidophilum]|uniref:Protein kinase n=1 Tax=Colletotrichum orchidophilum TaxID=1209926 RepID=A0A1G4AS03_9PEZI|nr:protein kinase [Colletotrichum orchidophilum]OHE91939.1 protein kinase [Colletotrichum orchidophilum]